MIVKDSIFKRLFVLSVMVMLIEGVLFTKLTGTLNIDQTESIEPAALSTMVTANIVAPAYSNETIITATQESNLTDSFGEDDEITTGEKTEIGSIALADPATGVLTTYAWKILRDTRCPPPPESSSQVARNDDCPGGCLEARSVLPMWSGMMEVAETPVS